MIRDRDWERSWTAWQTPADQREALRTQVVARDGARYERDPSPRAPAATTPGVMSGSTQNRRADERALSQITENRKVWTRKSLIFQYTIFGFCLEKAILRDSPLTIRLR